MLEFYKKRVEVFGMQLKLAKDGYEQKIKELPNDLQYADSVEEAEKIIDEVKFAQEAIKEIVACRDGALKDYNEWLKKQGEKNNG